MANINDLRSALELLQTIDGQYVETDVEVDPNAELSGVYRYVGAGGTVSRPTREGPAMVFNNVKGHPDARVAIGVLASRKRVGYLLGEKPENLGKLLNRAVSNPIPPVVVDASKAQCQEVVHYATEEDFDIRKLIPNARVREDINTDSGKAMPEFPGYTGVANPAVPIIKVKAVTTRKNPIMQSCIGPSEEHVSMAGIPTEASILAMVERAMPGKLQNVYCASCGGGKYMAVLQFKKSVPSDEGRQRQAALLAFSAFSELKHVFLVDEDVDCFDLSDVIWAMNTRFQADVDLIPIADMVPAMILVMPISALWVNYIMPLVS